MPNPAIIIIAFNRPGCLRRLLNSIRKGIYDTSEIPLVISIDGEGDPDVLKVANEFEWKFGKKQIIRHDKRLGLKDHVLACGDLSAEYGSIIVLEDDLLVSPGFYHYASRALEFYEKDEKIAGISLYSYDVAESCLAPFQPIEDGSGVFFMQVASSWGQAWTAGQWRGFRKWFGQNSGLAPNLESPSYLSFWSENSWKKHFIHYLISRDLFFVYPRTSFSTNFEEKGIHAETKNLYQVSLALGKKNLELRKIENSCAVYDATFELTAASLNKLVPELVEYDYEVDLYGVKDPSKTVREYFLTTGKCKHPVRTFGREMFPMILNVVHGIPGDAICLVNNKDILVRSENRSELFYKYTAIHDYIYSENYNRIQKDIYADVLTDLKFKSKYPLISVVISANENDLEKVVETIHGFKEQNYPRLEVLVAGPGLLEKKLKGLGDEVPNWVRIILVEAIGVNVASLESGLDAATGEIMATLRPGGSFPIGTLNAIGKVFSRYAHVNWATVFQEDLKIKEGDGFVKLSEVRWNENLFLSRLKQATNFVSEDLVFWRRELWGKTGGKLDSDYRALSLIELFYRFIQAEHLYTVLAPIDATYFNSIKKELAANTKILLEFDAVISKLETQQAKLGFFSGIIKSILTAGFMRDRNYLRFFFAELNKLPDLIRYDPKSDAYYFSRY